MSTRKRDREVGIALLTTNLQKKGIQLVAVDFDQTLITFHSGGVWKDNIEKLVAKVRPCMRDLIQTCLDRDIKVCIVTYFTQPWVIRELLQKLFKRYGACKKVTAVHRFSNFICFQEFIYHCKLKILYSFCFSFICVSI